MDDALTMPWWVKVALVASGGAVGAVCRVGLAGWVSTWAGQTWWGTLVVNLLGCVLLGGVRGAAEVHGWGSPQVRLWCAGGVLGALTTFSTFEMDVASLWAQGQRVGALAYLGGSVVGGLGAYGLGWWVMSRWK